MKRFLILARRLRPGQQAVISEAISKEFGWWHWTINAWLVVTNKDVTCAEFREKLKIAAPRAHLYIFEIDSVKDWTGFED